VLKVTKQVAGEHYPGGVESLSSRVFFIGGFRQIWRKNCYSEKMLGGKIVICVDFRQTVTEK
jgi:hypothetical protein